MEVLRDGTFSFTIAGNELARGLRSSKRAPRNAKFLVECVGAVGIDNILQVIDDLKTDRIDTGVIADAFPYPQVFVFTSVILVCGSQTIYEWDGTTLNSVIGPVTAGQLWSAVDYYRFIYLSNGVVTVLRNPTTGLYALSSAQPIANAICDFNGQVIIGGLVA